MCTIALRSCCPCSGEQHNLLAIRLTKGLIRDSLRFENNNDNGVESGPAVLQMHLLRDLLAEVCLDRRYSLFCCQPGNLFGPPGLCALRIEVDDKPVRPIRCGNGSAPVVNEH